MSYILEALKKAQAERQLGTSPTIHAPTLHAADQAATGGRFRKPLLLAVLAMAVVIVVLLALVLRSPAPAVVAQPPAQQAGAAASPAAPVLQAAPVSPAAPAPAPLPVVASVSAPVPAPLPVPLPAPVAALPPPVATSANRRSQPEPAVAAAPVPAAGTPQAATAAKPAPSEDPVVNLRDLPEPIQRAIPQVAVGGYIYSKNPADRLLLIDKVLRHEGEEVAPGLVLEKLQPKEAIFGFKGYRYRVPY